MTPVLPGENTTGRDRLLEVSADDQSLSVDGMGNGFSNPEVSARTFGMVKAETDHVISLHYLYVKALVRFQYINLRRG